MSQNRHTFSSYYRLIFLLRNTACNMDFVDTGSSHKDKQLCLTFLKVTVSLAAKMSSQLLGLLLFLLLACYNCVLFKPAKLEEKVVENVEEKNLIGRGKSYRSSETIDTLVEKMAILENMLELKSAEMIKLEQHVAELEARVEEGIKMQSEIKNEEVVNLKKVVKEMGVRVDEGLKQQCGAELSRTLNEVLPKAVQKGLRDLPFVMVCATRDGYWTERESVVTYDRIASQYDNADRPGGEYVYISLRKNEFWFAEAEDIPNSVKLSYLEVEMG